MRNLPSWVQWLLAHPHVIVIIVVFAGSLLARVVRQFHSIRKERERRAAIDRAEVEQLRTGRPVDSPGSRQPQTRSSAAQDEVAEARRRSIEEMHARKSGQQRPTRRAQASVRVPSTQPQPAPTTMTRTVRLPGGIVLEVPIAEAPTKQRLPRSQRGRTATPVPRQAPEFVPDPTYTGESTSKRRLADVPVPDTARPIPARGLSAPGAAKSHGLAALIGSNDRYALRRALVAREVLGPPKSLGGEL